MSTAIAILITVSSPTYFPEYLVQPTHRCAGKEERVVPFVEASRLASYAEVLEIAKEPAIYGDQLQKPRGMARIVRFTWLRTFHAPILIRVVINENGEAEAFATRLSGQGGYGYGKIASQQTKTLSHADVEKIMASSGPNAYPLDLTLCRRSGGLDGARWLMEGLDGEGYHFAQQWSPREGPLRDLGLLMLKTVGWENEEIY